jgi:hypothetical protein
MTIPTISITDITSSPDSGEGTGIFDILYAKVKQEVTEQFATGKLKGSEYAEVVLGSLTATLNQSIQFLMTRDELNYKLQLLELQKEAQKIENQKLKLEKDILEINKEIVELQKDEAQIKIELMGLEKITVGKQQIMLDKQNIAIDKQNSMLDKQQIMLDKQILTEEQKRLNMAQELSQIQAQRDMLLQQKANLIIEGDKIVQETGLIENNKLVAVQQKLVMAETVNKTVAETNLLNAKLTTENAQTQGTPAGLIGKQIELYEAQKVGLVKDAVQKKAKIASDVWSVARTTDPDATPMPLTTLEIGDMIKASA